MEKFWLSPLSSTWPEPDLPWSCSSADKRPRFSRPPSESQPDNAIAALFLRGTKRCSLTPAFRLSAISVLSATRRHLSASTVATDVGLFHRRSLRRAVIDCVVRRYSITRWLPPLTASRVAYSIAGTLAVRGIIASCPRGSAIEPLTCTPPSPDWQCGSRKLHKCQSPPTMQERSIVPRQTLSAFDFAAIALLPGHQLAAPHPRFVHRRPTWRAGGRGSLYHKFAVPPS